MPISVINTANAMRTGIRREGSSQYAKTAHNNVVMADAQVPGPGRSRPMPKNVATSMAQREVAAGEVGVDMALLILSEILWRHSPRQRARGRRYRRSSLIF